MRVLDEFLDVHTGVPEGLFGFCASGVVTFDQGDVVVGGAHAASAAAGDRLDHDGVTDPFGHGEGVLLVIYRAFRTRRSGDTGFSGQRAADRFVLQCVHGAGTGADKANVAALAHVGEVGVFRQEAIAG